jgi:hypothetical protein
VTSDISLVARLKDEVSGPLGIIRDNFDRLGASQGVMAMGRGFKMNVASMMASEFVQTARQVVAFGQEAVAKASDLAETVSKTENVFGESAAEILAWGETAARAFGQTKKQALDAATQFAGTFKSVGFAMDEVNDRSKTMVELGADLASFFNTDMADALHALRSGLGGEAEALRKYNVFISDAAVQSKLLEMGVKKVNGRFTEGQKVMARYQIIMDQTTDAQGDYERTADGLANSQRSVTAQIEDLTAKIGEELLPVAQELTLWVRDEGVPQLTLLIERAKELAEVWGWLGDQFGRDEWQSQNEQFMQRLEIQMHKTTVSAEEGARAFRAAERASLEAGWAAGDAADAGPLVSDSLAQAFRDVEDAAADAAAEIEPLPELIQAVADAAWGPEEAEIAFRDATREVDGLKAELKKLRDEKPAGWRKDVAEARDRLSEAKKEAWEAEVALKAVDGLTLAEVREMVGKLGGRAGYAADEIWRLYRGASNLDSLGALAFTNRSVQPGILNQHEAAGGTVHAGGNYIVGESGAAERLVMFPGGGGMVIPQGATGGGGGNSAPVVVQLNLDGREVARVVDRHLYYEAARAPRSSYAG